MLNYAKPRIFKENVMRTLFSDHLLFIPFLVEETSVAGEKLPQNIPYYSHAHCLIQKT